MKYILFITILLNSLLLASHQVILGTYSTHNSALNVKAQLNTIISQDTRFKDFLVKNSIRSIVKEKDNYFIVALQPINDIVTQHAILNRIQKTKFKDAFLAKMTEEIEEEALLISSEPDIDDIKIIQTKVTKAIEVKQQNLLNEYFNEIIASIVILLLSILYLMIKRRKYTDNEHDYLNTSKKEEIVQIDDPYEYTNDSTDDDNIYEMQTTNEIVFDALDDDSDADSDKNVDEIKDVEEETPKKEITSDVIKKEVPQRDKTTKDDFKDFKGIRIMIAEDNIINQKVLKGLLADSMINIVTVNDGQEALDYLEDDCNFSIILMDAHMPNMDGYEATKHIRSNNNYSHITVVALSGDTAKNDILNMKNVGMQEHLEKPLKMDPLYNVLYAYSKVQELDEELEQALYIEYGLDICGNDETFYKEILNDFLRENNKSVDKIKKLLNKNEVSKVQEYLLDLIGMAGNIGADRIKELAGELRVALGDTSNNKYVDILRDYSKNYKNLEKEIKEYL